MIHLFDNDCPCCSKKGLSWNLSYSKSQMELFRCSHGTCKDCFPKIQDDFECPVCLDKGQSYSSNNLSESTKVWKTFDDWYGDYRVYIESGMANNVVRHTNFGRQLLRLIKENKDINKSKLHKSKSTKTKPNK